MRPVGEGRWLEVRILPGPPGSQPLAEISRRLANCPELASCGRSVSKMGNWGFGALSGGLVSGLKFGLPETETAHFGTHLECEFSRQEVRASGAIEPIWPARHESTSAFAFRDSPRLTFGLASRARDNDTRRKHAPIGVRGL